MLREEALWKFREALQEADASALAAMEAISTDRDAKVLDGLNGVFAAVCLLVEVDMIPYDWADEYQWEKKVDQIKKEIQDREGEIPMPLYQPVTLNRKPKR